ncbi:MAG: sulfatase, partial [Caulobacterales bacterium]|nr:sulfatase [Caulobacterales bacterium]
MSQRAKSGSWRRALTAALALAAIGSAPGCADDAPRPPNILIAISDDQSFPHASAYGGRFVDTPGFDAVAEAGVLFTNAFAASPGCSPSRAALLTGRHVWMLEAAGTHASGFDPAYVAISDMLEAAGYHVGYTGKGWAPGDWRSERARNPVGEAFNERTLTPPTSGVSSTDYAANFADFLNARDEGAPFFFWFGAHEPHRRFEKGSWRAAGKRLEDAQVPPFLPDTDEVRGDLLDYAVEIEWFDAQLQEMLARLEAMGERANTLVVVTSDNGMAFPRAKANLYDAGLRTPMAISWPARAPGGRTTDALIGF